MNNEEKFYWDFTKAIKTAKISQLEEHKQAYEKYNKVNKTDMCNRLLAIVNSEIDRRKLFKLIKL